MRGTSEGKICRVIRTEVRGLAGASGAVVLSVEHLPLADLPPDEKANVTVFIMDQRQALMLEDQLVEFGAHGLRLLDTDG